MAQRTRKRYILMEHAVGLGRILFAPYSNYTAAHDNDDDNSDDDNGANYQQYHLEHDDSHAEHHNWHPIGAAIHMREMGATGRGCV